MSEPHSHHEEHEETWRFILGVQIPPRDLQLVATLSDDPKDPSSTVVFFYLAIMCAPITGEMLKESEPLRKWCNNQQSLDLDRDDVFTWSADGLFKHAPSAECVLWTHASIEQLTMPRRKARRAVVAMGDRLARILNNSCRAERSIELLFAIRQNNWMEEAPGTIGYSEAVGALAQLIRACRSVLLMGQLKYNISTFHYYHRSPHVSILDLVAMQNFGHLTFYTRTKTTTRRRTSIW